MRIQNANFRSASVGGIHKPKTLLADMISTDMCIPAFPVAKAGVLMDKLELCRKVSLQLETVFFADFCVHMGSS